MDRYTITVFSKGHQVNSESKTLSPEEYEVLVKELQDAQSGKVDSLTIVNRNDRYLIPKKQLLKSIITITKLNV